MGGILSKMEQYQVKIIRTARKTISLSLDENLDVLVRVPYFVSDRDVMRLVEKKADWINKHRNAHKHRSGQMAAVERLTAEQLERLAEEAKAYLPQRVRYYAGKMSVSYGRITIRNQRTRWGSCSGKGNLNFNCLLMLMPEAVIDYVVVHELCHRIEMNHSKRFWDQVARVLPDYRSQKDWLRQNGEMVMRRMTG